MESGAPKLLDRVRTAVWMRHYSPRTEEAYVHWIRRYVVFHGKRHPGELGDAEVSAFLSSLARRGVSASTQNQALSAVLFLYEVVIGERPVWTTQLVRAHRPSRVPVVLSRDEVARLLGHLHGPVGLMASLMYGAGLRLMECVELRVKDVHLDRGELTVRDGKGGKDRVTLLPVALRHPLADHLVRMKALHARDVAAGRGAVALPGALRSKYPQAPWEWAWQWVFPATRFYRDGQTGERRRHHLHESVVQRAVKEAMRAAGIARPATYVSLVAPLVRHAPAGGRVRYQDDPGATRSSRCEDDHDLHPCGQAGRSRCTKSARSARHVRTMSRRVTRWRAGAPVVLSRSAYPSTRSATETGKAVSQQGHVGH